MPRLVARLAVACCIAASLLSALLWAGGCAVYAPVTPSPSALPGPDLAREPAHPPADFGCLVYHDQGADQPVWLLKGGNPPRRLAQAGWALISPDGHTVASVRRFPAELWVLGSDGTREERLYTAPMGSPLIDGLLLAPDGGSGVIDLTCPGCPASQEPGALWRVDMATGAVRQLADHGAHWPVFSPDGNWLSVASPLGTLASHGSLGLIDVEGRGNLVLFEFILVRDRAWAADSSGFVVAFERMTPPSVPTELWWIPIAGSPLPLGQLADVADLSWQPGGERVVARKWVRGGPTRLTVADRDGSGEMFIPGSEGMSPRSYGQLPSWSPDGRWLLTMLDGGTYFLLDMNTLRLHPIEAQVVHGWLDAGHYLASLLGAADLERYQRGDEALLDLYRCVPLGPCEWLAQIPRLAHLSYTPRCP